MTVRASEFTQRLGQSFTRRSRTRPLTTSCTSLGASLAGLALSISVMACTAETAQPEPSAQPLVDARDRPGRAGGNAGTAGTPTGAAGTGECDVHRRARHGERKRCPAACGDGVRQADEQCDDGNTAGGDGCSASCLFDDDLGTVGDDRPGFMACGDRSCATNGECCGDVSAGMRMCIADPSACIGGPNHCDGPEDCAAGEVCWEARWALCLTNDSTQPRGARRCHTDAHCNGDQRCTNGLCFVP